MQACQNLFSDMYRGAGVFIIRSPGRRAQLLLGYWKESRSWMAWIIAAETKPELWGKSVITRTLESVYRTTSFLIAGPNVQPKSGMIVTSGNRSNALLEYVKD